MFTYRLEPGWIDTHCHLTNPRLSAVLPAVLARSTAKGMGNFCLGGIGPEDWEAQANLLSYPGIIPCFGLHPYWVSEHSSAECEAALQVLEKKLPASIGIGEMGLDFRGEILRDDPEKQQNFFQRQLELAKKYRKVPVLHIVRAHADANRILTQFGDHGRSGLVHAFNSDKSTAKIYLDRGYYLSIGGPLLRKNNHALAEAVAFAPLERLCLESDSPDQPPPGMTTNEPWTILLVAERVAELKGLATEAVLTAARTNFIQIFHEEIKT